MQTHHVTCLTERFRIRRAAIILFAGLLPGLSQAAPDDPSTPGAPLNPGTPQVYVIQNPNITQTPAQPLPPGTPLTPNTYISPSTPLDPSTALTLYPSDPLNPSDVLSFVVGGSVAHDDNLFRLSSSAPTPSIRGTSSKSDTIATLYAGIRVDKPLGMQRLQLDVTAIQYKYQTHSYLDFSTVNYRAAWLWAVSPRLTGVLSADKYTELESYSTLQSNSSDNTRANENQRFAADWWVDGGWHLTGGVHRLRSEADNANTTTGNYVENTAEGGVKYVSAANNSIAAVSRTMRGNYLDRTLNPTALLDTDYDQRENEIRVIYQLGGHSLLDGRIAYKDRTFDHYTQRDYSGTVGGLNFLWVPTGKLQFNLFAGRDLLPYQSQTSSYYSTNFVNLTPSWMVTDKTTLRLSLNYSQDDYRGAVVPIARMREDSTRSVQFGANWRPTRTILIDGYVTHEDRSSNIPGQSYKDNIYGVMASGTF